MGDWSRAGNCPRQKILASITPVEKRKLAQQAAAQLGGVEEAAEGDGVLGVDARLDHAAVVLLEASDKLGGAQEVGIAVDAGDASGVEVDAAEVGVTALEGDADVFLLLPVGPASTAPAAFRPSPG